ncbi:ElyC/SanA/YdcF family protein [Pseudonocardia nematodicida]|uniref:ElyC/SanA/YdcF family protein n=1 Tax=Pseudonocardia nematodicida TaxID=1206997 RepID=A0ABV1KFA4_9PSEU
MRPFSELPVFRMLGVVVLLGGLVGAAANLVVVQRTAESVTGDVSRLRPAQVAIVPGSLVRSDGSLGEIVRARVEAGVALYHRGTVDALLMSGDNSTASYDEPGAMRDAALAAGVAPEDVFTDYAGFSTWHTMRRANEIFQVTSAVVVTQDLYAARSVDLAHAAGLDAQGLLIGDGGRAGREWLARVRGLAEATIRPKVTAGPAIPIDGDGRRSWAEPLS